MVRGAVAVLVLTAGALAGCQTSGYDGGYYSPGPGYSSGRASSDYSDDSPSINNTSGGAREALKAGCRERYDNDRKYRECLNGNRHSEEALAVGCAKRYPNDGAKMRRCLAGN